MDFFFVFDVMFHAIYAGANKTLIKFDKKSPDKYNEDGIFL